MNELIKLKLCSLLHDIGKPECWAKQEPWSDHIRYTFETIKRTFGEGYAYTSMRHHSGPSYPSEYHPKTEFEKIICLADNLASGADGREEPKAGTPLPRPPLELTQVLSRGEKVRKKIDAQMLDRTAMEIEKELEEAGRNFGQRPEETYQNIYDFLEKSNLRFIPADTRSPINDVSLWDHLKLTAAFSTCIWLDGGYKGDNPEKYAFALLSGDADKVSQFVATSLRLPDLEARSNRIKRATEAAASSIKKNLGPECLIFAGGGSFLAISPEKGVGDVALKAKEAFEDFTQGEVTIAVSYVIAGGERVLGSFGDVWRDAMREMQLKKLIRPASMPPSLNEGVKDCDACHIRPAVHKDRLRILPIDAAPRPESLCDHCWQLRKEGTGASLDSIKGKTNFVAILKADGDDMGEVLRGKRFRDFNKNNTPSRLSVLSSLIHETCEEKLSKLVETHGGTPVFAGGDDVLAVLPGDVALEAASNLASEFRSEMAGECTMSAGVAIFHYKLPVYVGLEAAQELLSKAKEGKNSVAFAIIGGSGIGPDEMKGVRPYGWDELREMLGVVEFMRKSGLSMSQIRRIAGAAKRDPDEAKIIIKYLIGRKIISWNVGKKLISYLKSGFLSDAFLVYNTLVRGAQIG